MGEVAKTLVSLSGPESVHGIIPEKLIKREKGYDPARPENAVSNARVFVFISDSFQVRSGGTES